MSIADSTTLATFSFTELSIDYSDSNTTALSTFPTESDHRTYIKGLAINSVRVFSEDFVFFSGSMVIFAYRRSTFAPAKFKSLANASTSLVGMFPYNGNLIVVGKAQVTYLRLSDFRITHNNFIGVPQ